MNLLYALAKNNINHCELVRTGTMLSELHVSIAVLLIAADSTYLTACGRLATSKISQLCDGISLLRY